MKAGILIAGVAGLAVGFALGWSPTEIISRRAKEAQAPTTESTPESVAVNQEPSAAHATSGVGSATVPRKADPSLSPKKRLFRRAMRDWDPEARYLFLWHLFVGHKEAQARLLEFLLSSPDSAVLEAGKDLLIANHEPEFVRRITEALRSETNEDRRSMLAHALGGNARNPEARAMIEQILAGSDASSTLHVLTRLNMESFGDRSDIGLRIEAQLRGLVMVGPTAEIRQQAVLSLRGGESEDQIRFLLNLVEGISDPKVRRAAIRSLPVTFSSHPPLVDEQLGALWVIARNEACDLGVRRAAANVLRNSQGMGSQVTSDTDQDLVKKLLESKP